MQQARGFEEDLPTQLEYYDDLQGDSSIAHVPPRSRFRTVLYSAFRIAGICLLLLLSTAFGFGFNGAFPLLAFLQVALAQLLLLHAHPDRRHESWWWTVSKFFLLWLCLTFAYSFGFAGSFRFDPEDASRSYAIVLGICAVVCLGLALLVHLPFYRAWTRFQDQSNSLGLLLLSLVLPTLYTTYWFLIQRLLPIGDFVHPAYSQLSFHSFIMFAAFFGLSGVAFVMCWSSFALFCVGWSELRGNDEEERKKRFLLMIAVATIVLVGACTCGSFQALAASGNFYQKDIARDSIVQQQFKVGCIINGDFQATKQLLTKSNSNEAGEKPYSFVLWSEGSTSLWSGQQETFLPELQDLARETQTVLLPAFMNDTKNMLALIDERGELLYTYQKRHPVPGEGITPGPGVIHTATTGVGAIAAAICFDLNFPHYISDQVSKEAQLLAQPSETWGPIGEYHAGTNAVRSIEHGFVLVRCSSEGYSGVFSPDGKWSQLVPDGTSGVYSMVAPSRPKRVFTLYDAIGDVFAWFCVAMSAVYVVGLVFMPTSVLRRIPHKWLQQSAAGWSREREHLL
ncbi:Carbon-nitrogen hydrolase family protein [Balamuthia mandrillaris]